MSLYMNKVELTALLHSRYTTDLAFPHWCVLDSDIVPLFVLELAHLEHAVSLRSGPRF